MKVLHDYGENLLQRAKAAGMVDEDAGVPYWVPHMAAMIGADGQVAQVPRGPGKGDGINAGKIEGTNLRTSAESLMQRKHQTIEEAEAAGKKAFGPDFKMVHDILTMPLAMGRLERAIAGRELINRIQEMGKTTGENLVDIHGNSETHFTINHPAFTTYKWKKDSMPVQEGHDQQLWDGLSKVAEALGVTHQRLANLKGRAWGLSYQGRDRVQTKFAGPETVLTHELGHQIDHKYGLIKEMQGTPGVPRSSAPWPMPGTPPRTRTRCRSITRSTCARAAKRWRTSSMPTSTRRSSWTGSRPRPRPNSRPFWTSTRRLVNRCGR